MTTVTGIASVDRRISVIESKIAARLGVSSDRSPASADFGSAYEQAVQQVAAHAPQQSQQPRQSPLTVPTSASLRIDSVGGLAVRTGTASYGSQTSSDGHTVGQVGGYGEMPVPAALAAYGNGQIPADALEPIGQGDHRLFAPAAEAWKVAVAAAAAEGVDLRVTDSYRSLDQQVGLAAEKGLYADGGLAAVPGTSNHGWGLAVDVDTDTPGALQWMQANGHRFGFVEAVRREPWHWEYRPAQA